MNEIERLKEYINLDKPYQDFKNNKTDYDEYTDFTRFCIQHCKDIEYVLEENEKLRGALETHEILQKSCKCREWEQLKEWLEDRKQESSYDDTYINGMHFRSQNYCVYDGVLSKMQELERVSND